jgi:hypothetical protein
MSGATGQTFTDSAGRTWLVEVNAWQLKRVRQALGVELGKMSIDQLAKLVTDPEPFVDVLFVLLKDQAEKLPLTDEEFGRGLGGDGLESAVVAFWRAWADFCPSQTRPLMLRLAKEAEAMTAEAVAGGMAKLDALSRLDHTTLSDFVTNSPAPRESTPGRTPSAS